MIIIIIIIIIIINASIELFKELLNVETGLGEASLSILHAVF